MTYSRLANPRETRAVLEGFGPATKHRLGQNFLVNDEVIGRIVDLAELDGSDVVLEVGPGIGTLTVAMRSGPAGPSAPSRRTASSSGCSPRPAPPTARSSPWSWETPCASPPPRWTTPSQG